MTTKSFGIHALVKEVMKGRDRIDMTRVLQTTAVIHITQGPETSFTCVSRPAWNVLLTVRSPNITS